MNTSKLRATARLAGLALLIGLPLTLPAQDIKPAQAGFSAARLQRVDEFIDRHIASGEVSGGVALVARNGRIVHLTARGVMDVQSKQPMQKDSVFRIASMSKPVAGVAILMLVEEGKVHLDDPVSKYLPSYRDVKVAMPRAGRAGAAGQADAVYPVPAQREITVFDILTHTSGLMSGAASNAGGQAAFQQRHEIGLKWVDNLGKDSLLEFQPGTRWAYSPVAALDVAGRIVEIVSGKNFDQFLKERVFGPLGMKDTFFWPNDAQRARLVTNYRLADGKLSPNPNPDSMSSPVYFSGGGGLMSSAASYARFAMMLANGGELDGARILSPAMVRLMGSQVIGDDLPGRRPGEGYGLSVRHVNDPAARRTLLSEGSFGWSGAYGTHFWVDPSKHLVGILMMQTPGQNRADEFETVVMQALEE
ncbi:MAG: beta-lactamase family protein [Nevskiaceae bacterium]|jgi:CubicO group peptidase (beta-lactamase class C family)|nr:beta-lactamase family protein [Nevskiaceae bacterium]